jgi:hypothetical protein
MPRVCLFVKKRLNAFYIKTFKRLTPKIKTFFGNTGQLDWRIIQNQMQLNIEAHPQYA